MLPFEFNLGLQQNFNCIYRQWATLIFMAWITKVTKKWQGSLQYILCQSTWDPGYLASIAICSTGSSNVFAPVVPKINIGCGVCPDTSHKYQRLTEIADRSWVLGKEGNLLVFFQWFLFNFELFFFFSSAWAHDCTIGNLMQNCHITRYP